MIILLFRDDLRIIILKLISMVVELVIDKSLKLIDNIMNYNLDILSSQHITHIKILKKYYSIHLNYIKR